VYNDNFSSTVVQRVNVEGEQWLAPVLVVLGAQDELVISKAVLVRLALQVRHRKSPMGILDSS
jgi:hypothetical protein